jgi:hypothetical protein
MKIGIVGYQGCGKSALFEWLTGIEPDLSKAHQTQSAMAVVPDERVAPMCEVYSPKKITLASLELVDTPGLDRRQEGNAARLAQIREAGCLLIVTPAFSGGDSVADVASFEEDLLLADLEIVSGRVERLRESVKKPRPTRDQELAELAALEPLVGVLEAGTPLHEVELSEEQRRATRSFQLLTDKPRLIIVNIADDEEDPARLLDPLAGKGRAVAVAIGLELELARMDQSERAELVAEMGLTPVDRDELLRTILDVSGQMLYFTAGEKEVRTWMLRQGGTALEAADNIHSDLARGFIRAEVFESADLLRLGGERELKAAGLMRQEPKDYVVKDGDVLNIKFSV